MEKQARQRPQPPSQTRCRAPQPSKTTATLPAKYFTKRALSSIRPWAQTADGHAWKTLSVCPLSLCRGDLQSLRSRQPLLHPALCRTSTAPISARHRQTLSSRPARAHRPRPAAAPLPGPSANSDASGFPTPAPGCSTGARTDAAGQFPARTLLPLPPRVTGSGPSGFPACSDSPLSIRQERP
jgi:hypothetical protein